MSLHAMNHVSNEKKRKYMQRKILMALLIFSDAERRGNILLL